MMSRSANTRRSQWKDCKAPCKTFSRSARLNASHDGSHALRNVWCMQGAGASAQPAPIRRRTTCYTFSKQYPEMKGVHHGPPKSAKSQPTAARCAKALSATPRTAKPRAAASTESQQAKSRQEPTRGRAWIGRAISAQTRRDSGEYAEPEPASLRPRTQVAPHDCRFYTHAGPSRHG